MTVPLLDLRAQYATIREEVRRRVDEVLDSQQCIDGPVVQAFEQAFAAYTHTAHAVGVSSGTDALLASLMALGVGPGDEVITTPFSFIAPAECIARLGARPVFADIDPCSFNLDPGRVEALLGARTRAILPVHLFGQMAQMSPLLELAKARGLALVEDAAQSVGARYRGQMAGSLGTVGCFSFFPSKNLGAAGDGGMVVTQDPELAVRIRHLGRHGSGTRYIHESVGGNFRLDALQAAILHVKLGHLDAWAAARQARARRYDAAFAEQEGITVPRVHPEGTMVYNQYVVRLERRDVVQKALQQAGIGHAIYYPLALHQQPCFAHLGHAPKDFPEAQKACREVLALPVYPELTDVQQDRVIEVVLGTLSTP